MAARNLNCFHDEATRQTFEVFETSKVWRAGFTDISSHHSLQNEEGDMESSTTADGALLVIEDNANVREALIDALELAGWRVIAAPNGRTGIDLFRQHRAEVALLILDLLMPDMDGARVLRAVRELDPRIKVIISSGYDESEGLRWLSDRDSLGRPTAFLHKPYTLESLVSIVQRVLAQ